MNADHVIGCVLSLIEWFKPLLHTVFKVKRLDHFSYHVFLIHIGQEVQHLIVIGI